MTKVNTTQVGDKLFILNGVDPIRYVDLTRNKVHQYKEPPQRWLKIRRFALHLVGRQPIEDVLFYHKQGFKTVGAQKNVMNILTTEVKNICVWYDGTMHPARGHDGSCQWGFDGQVFWHKPLTTNNHS